MRTLYLRCQKNLALIALFIIAFCGASFAEAQVKPQNPSEAFLKEFPEGVAPGYMPIEPVTGNNVVNCFDYYHFGSVQVNMEGNVAHAVSGTPLLFSGKIINQNSYPIVDGAVYAKVFKRQSEESSTRQNGNNLVDQFFVKENISLSANSEIPLRFEWNIPSYAVSGDYQIAFFFTSAHKFNLLGLSFTDDVVGNIFNFSINGEQKAIPFFNKNTIKINNSLYRFAAFPPHRGTYENAVIDAELVNPTDKIQVAQITWKLYSWDAQSESNLLDTKKEDVSLSPGETRTLTYTDNRTIGVVHLLVVEAKYKDTKSLLNIRYVRDGAEAIRLNFPSITSYPLEKNKETTLFSCVHNAGVNTVPDGKLTLTIKDHNGKPLHTYTYTGAISSAMMAVKDGFTPSETLKTFSLEAKLFQKGKQIDEATMVYDCEKLGGKDCPKKNISLMGIDANTLKIDIALFILLLIVLSLSFLKKRKQQNQEKIKTPIKIIAFTLLIAASWSFGGVERAEANSVVVKSAALPALKYCWSNGIIRGICYGYIEGLQTGAVVTTSYHAQMINADTQEEILDQENIPVGTKISFSMPLLPTDISWDGTGQSMDTPYGMWSNDALAPAPEVAGTSDFFVNNYNVNGSVSYDIYIPLVIYRPTENIISLTTSTLSCSSVICTVIGDGQIKAKVTFPTTTGKFYYEYVTKVGNAVDLGGYVTPKTYFNKVAMSTGGPSSWSCKTYPCTGTEIQAPYILQVPEQSITFNLSGVTLNKKPSVPTITPASANDNRVGNKQYFDIKSTDPDGDNIKYCIDWGDDGIWGNNCGVASPYLASNIPWPMWRTFPTATTYKFVSKAVDIKGSSSDWTAPHIITIGNQKENGVCSTVSPGVCLGGDVIQSPADTTTDYRWSCSGLYGGTTSDPCHFPKPINATCGIANNVCPKGGETIDLLDSPTTRYWECPGINGGTNKKCEQTIVCTGSSCMKDASCTLPKTTPAICTGALPAVPTPTAYRVYSGDEPPSVNTPYTYSATDTATKCQYGCNTTDSYIRSGGECVLANYSCKGSVPTPLNAYSLYAGDDEDLLNNTTSYSYASTDSATKCQYGCTDGYVRYGSGSSAACVIPFCSTANIPLSAHLWNVNESKNLPTTGTPYSPYLNTLSNEINHPAIKCEYKCNDGYVPNTANNGCVSDGLCGTASSKIYPMNVSPEQFAPDTLCDVGVSTPSVVPFPAKGQSVLWKCGKDRCSTSRQQDATCGYKKGIPSFIKPTPVDSSDTSLCMDATAPAVTENTTVTPKSWDWTCLGWFGGVPAYCSAPKSTFKFWEF